MRLHGIEHGKQLRVQGCYTQFTRNSTCNSGIGDFSNAMVCQWVKRIGIARVFACKAPANNTQFEAEELDAIIRRNLPACRGGHGAGREVLGYGE